MVSYIVAASFFVLSSSYLVGFVIEPPGSGVSNLESLDLKHQAQHALSVLLDTPGIPAAWSSDPDQVTRLGLVQQGATIRVDPAKFTALAQGKLATKVHGNGFVDYQEAKDALGFEDHEFHLRAYPVTAPGNDYDFGVVDLEDYRVAYVGSFSGETYSRNAEFETDALDALGITFLNATRTSNANGDVYQQPPGKLRQHLLGELGTTIRQVVLSGAPTVEPYNFSFIDKSAYVGLTNLTPPTSDALSTAMAITDQGTLGYAKDRELRAIVGTVDLDGVTSAELQWAEWVDTDRGTLAYDCGDFGYVEVSHDGGATWVQLTGPFAPLSQDCLPTPQAPLMTSKHVTIDASTCAACLDETILVAFHWVSDHDDQTGYGWIVDNLYVRNDANGDVLLVQKFEPPTYDLLVIGSDVAQQTHLAKDDIERAIRDYVDVHGGRLLVLGGSGQSATWLDDLLLQGQGGGSGGIHAPDLAHPLLTTPNPIHHADHAAGDPWDFTSSPHRGLFHAVLSGTAQEHYRLAASKSGAWGSDGGNVILTSWEPHDWSKTDARRFFANAIVYGRFHYLHMDLGPPIPQGIAIGSASRTSTMDWSLAGAPAYGEIRFDMHVWPGTSQLTATPPPTIFATAPTDLVATADDAQVSLAWSEPASTALGTGTGVSYRLLRGSSPDSLAEHAIIPWGTNVHVDGSLMNGETYWYAIKVETNVGTPSSPIAGIGGPSPPVGATPSATPAAPTAGSVTPGAGSLTFTWTAPAQNGGATILGYRVWVSDEGSPTTYSLAGEVGRVTSYWYETTAEEARSFKVEAINARGVGAISGASAPPVAPLIPAAMPQTLSVSNLTVLAPKLTLSWAAPSSYGTGAHTGYKVLRSTTPNDEDFALLATLTSLANVSFIDENVAGNTRYYYKVQATTSIGDGLLSGAADNLTWDPNHPPGHPTPFSATNVNDNHVLLTWTAPTSWGAGTPSGYRVYRAENGGAFGQLVYLASAANVSFQDFALGPGKTYQYYVRAQSSVAEGFASTTQSVAPTVTLPNAPTGLAVSNVTIGALSLTWGSGGWGTGTPIAFDIERSTNGVDFTPFARTLTSANTSFLDLNVASNTSYWYRVSAVSTVGPSPASDVATAKTKGAPWQVTGLAKTGGIPGTTIVMSWTPANTAGSTILTYEIHKNGALAGTVTSPVTSWTDVAPGAGAQLYKVRAVNAVGSGPFSTEVSMTK